MSARAAERAPLRLLHTGDWHVGRRMRGRSRADEHRRALAALVELARAERVDLVAVAGDLFESAAPSPEAEEIVYSTLLALADTGAHVVVVAGNHDNAERLAAVRPLLERAGRLTVATVLGSDPATNVEVVQTPAGAVGLALLPWVAPREVVGAAELMAADPNEHAGRYGGHVASRIAALAAVLPADAWRLLVGHAMVAGARLGGGEVPIFAGPPYAVPAAAFDASFDYAALAHVHRAQALAAPAPSWYCGAPLALDFGEETNTPGALRVDLLPGAPPAVRPVALAGGRPLRTLEGTLDAVVACAGEVEDAWVRVRLDEAPRAGLVEAVRRAIPLAVAVELAPAVAEPAGDWELARLYDRSPREVFAAYLAAQGSRPDAEPLLALFTRLEEADAAP